MPVPVWEGVCREPVPVPGGGYRCRYRGGCRCRCGAEAAGPAGAGDRVQELLHGVPERAGAAARPRRVPALGDLPAGPVPDALPTHRGGLPGLLLPPPAPGQHVRMGPWRDPPLWGSHPGMAHGPRGVWCRCHTDPHGCEGPCAPPSPASPHLGSFRLGWGGGFGRYPKSCPQAVSAPVITLPGPCPADAV